MNNNQQQNDNTPKPRKQRLELTWIGKDEELKLEPRILIEDPEKSYGDPNSENMLIHGDNLLALKALEQDYAGKVKCIYIDPPYNISAATDHYDDFLEHSEWLNLMKPRLEILKKLLAKDGCIFISIDDEEAAYLKVITDEIFLRSNFLNTISLKTGESQRAIGGGVNKKLRKKSEFLLFYCKDINYFNFNPIYEKTFLKDIVLEKAVENKKYEYRSVLKDYGIRKEFGTINASGQSEIIVYKHEDYKIESINYSTNKMGDALLVEVEKYHSEAIKYFDKVFRTAISQSSILKKVQEISDGGLLSLDYIPTSGKNKGVKTTRYFFRGSEVVFLKDSSFVEDGNIIKSELLGNIWTDIKQQGIASEGAVQFKFGKKPEKLIERIINLSTQKGDFIIDSFLGSGTTAAVAHKMNRKYIGIELGEHANTHCIPRLKSVVDGTDQGGISKAVNWKGGGGFKFYNLAPSLLRKDKYGNWIIDEKYNANMLTAAMCKHEGFRFSPHEELYWKQGQSTETDYIFVTTAFVTVEQLDKIHEEMGENESLLICAKSFASECENRHPNITVKKIPLMILGKCEFGQENYDLNIIQATEEVAEDQDTNHEDYE